MNEFADCMTLINKKTEEHVRQNFSQPKADKILKLLQFSFDNAAIHNCPRLLETHAGISPSQRVPIPPYCCDLQQPIEHAHGRFKMALRKELRRPDAHGNTWWPTNLDELRSKCDEVWDRVNSRDVVSKDVERLKDLYKHLHVVSEGSWAPHDYS